MEITYHAAVRFLERVMKKEKFTQREVFDAKNFLNGLFANVITHRRYVVVPEFSSYVGVVKNNKLITILDKKNFKLATNERRKYEMCMRNHY